MHVEVFFKPESTHDLSARDWYVYVEGTEEPVGPVSADQLARGIRAGKVPTDASVKRTHDVFWAGILDEPAIIEALKAL